MGELRSAATPGIDGIDEVDRDDDVEITGSDATRFRGVAARCNYLAFDRPDIQPDQGDLQGDVQAYDGKPSTVAEVGPVLEGQNAPRLELRNAGALL